MSLPPNAADSEIEVSKQSSMLPVDLASSYALTGVRVLVAALITGMFYRDSAAAAAVFIVGRSMLSVLSYAFAGFNPVVQHEIGRRPQQTTPVVEPSNVIDNQPGPPVLGYEARPLKRALPLAFVNGQFVALLMFFLVLILGVIYGKFFVSLHGLSGVNPSDAADLITPLVWGFGLRLASEPAGALLQQSRRLWVDNIILILGELLWIAWVVLDFNSPKTLARLVGDTCAYSGMIVFAVRGLSAMALGLRVDAASKSLRLAMMRRIVVACAIVSLGHVADFLYAPFNILLIGRALAQSDLLAYGPLLQIDSALLLLVAALASVVLPRAIAAAARCDLERLRSLYLRASAASLGLLTIGAIGVYLGREEILVRWLGVAPAQTLQVLPLLLIHTVIGGTAGVGRAVLLGMGRFKAYTISALLGGIANVVLALLFVVVLDMGLIGIVLATVISVTARCALWMPAYILRALARESV